MSDKRNAIDSRSLLTMFFKATKSSPKKGFFCCLLIIFLSGCTATNDVSTSKNVEKVISLYPAITETIYYLNAESYLHGRSDYCTTPNEATKLPTFGSSLTPNYEAIALAQPDKILLDQSNGNPLDSLQRIAPVTQLPWLTKEEVTSSIVNLGKMLDKPQAAQQLANQLKKALQSTATPSSPTMLVLMAGSDIKKGQLWFMRHDSLHGAAITAAGYRNAAPQSFKGPPSMSLEQLMQQNPDIIVFLPSQKVTSEKVEQLIKSMQILPSLKAVQKNRVGVLNGDNLMGVGPNIMQLVQAIQQQGQLLSDRK